MAEIVAGVVSTKLAKVIKDLESILSQLDVSLSSRASESTVSSINSRLPSSLTPSGNLKVAPQEVLKGDWLSAIPNPPNLDVPLSSRASESTLSGIKSQTDKLTFDTDNRLAIQNPPNLDVLLSTRASESTLSAIKNALASVGTDKILTKPDNPPALDVALSVLSRLIRWGRDVSPVWIHSGEVSAPTAGTALVSQTVSSGKVGFIYGFYITASEANDFLINWVTGGASKSIRIKFTGAGSLQYVDFIPLNEGLPADGGSSITITNVNAGSTGSVYQARLLYVEV